MRPFAPRRSCPPPGSGSAATAAADGRGILPLRAELAVIVTRRAMGPPRLSRVETINRDHICHVVKAPAPVEAPLAERAPRSREGRRGGRRVAAWDGAVPPRDGRLLVNEIAPASTTRATTPSRPATSRSSRTTCAPCWDCRSARPDAGAGRAMVNLLGGARGWARPRLEDALAVRARTSTCTASSSRPGRKMGHVTALGPVWRRRSPRRAGRGENPIRREIMRRSDRSRPRPLVGIIMGSDSDLPTMQAAADACAEFGVPFEMRVVSAHRTPSDMARYAQGAESAACR